MDDIQFTFDVAPFMTGIDKVTRGLTGWVQSAKKTAGGMTSSLKSVWGSMGEGSRNMVSSIKGAAERVYSPIEKLAEKIRGLFKHQQTISPKKTADEEEKKMVSKNEKEGNFLKKNADLVSQLTRRVMGLAAGYVGIRKALEYLPEVGQTFKIAGDIILRNLLWPLRKELMPMLQKILDWVRDNRTTFVRWGTVLANVFRTIVQIFKTLWQAVQPLLDSFKRIFDKLFKGTIKSISDMVNLLLFRVAVVAIGIIQLLEPVFKTIGKIIEWCTDRALEFGKGFTKAVTESQPFASDFIETLKDIWGNLEIIFGKTGDCGGAFEDLGDILGTVLITVLRLINIALEAVSAKLAKVMSAIEAWGKVMEGDWKGASDVMTKSIENENKSLMKQGDILGKIGKDWQGLAKRSLVRRGIAAEETGAGVGLTGVSGAIRGGATVKPTALTQTQNVNAPINVYNKIEVKVDEEKDAAKKGTTFGEKTGIKINDIFKKSLDNYFAVTGAR